MIQLRCLRQLGAFKSPKLRLVITLMLFKQVRLLKASPLQKDANNLRLRRNVQFLARCYDFSSVFNEINK